ncbi:uncharacterized protein LOC114538490 [Dendronephthya gigantea]|uniref:uncharacterized protein LOC114538490 n=1 Tax=Dendronephthya gigantea TaxID=151771 RepID=UPI00106C0A89|nr:uncharacterized protein LOC114538490 [Dendronephthya gigantea]
METIHKNQVDEVLPYQHEPEIGEKSQNLSEYSDSDVDSESLSSDEEHDHIFEEQNAWRLESLDWCKCGNCNFMSKTIESFCCHEKALEYNEYDALLNEVETLGEKCLTAHSDFINNMLAEGVLKIDVCRYLEENWPVDDEDLERTHKLYRLVSYQRCSRWIFQILGRKNRRPFSACVYLKIREQFASPEGLYTHFKYSKTCKR